MGWKVTIMLFEEGRDQVRHVGFEGDSPQDLAMLGAAKGFLEGLYEESKGARGLVGMLPVLEQMEETLQRIINPPRKPAVAIGVMGPMGPVTVEAPFYEAARAAADLIEPPLAPGTLIPGPESPEPGSSGS